MDLVEDKACADGASLVLNHENILMVRTFSKGFGIAGFRFGYCVAQPTMMEQIKLHHGGTPSAMSLTAALAALNDPDHLIRTREVANTSKSIYYSGFQDLGLEYIRSQAAFVLVKVDDARVVTNALADLRILVINAESSWGLKGMIRVSYGTEEESHIFVNALGNLLR